MSQYALRIPESLFRLARKCAEEDDVSLNQFFVVAIAEKVSALTTAEYFRDRAKHADVKAYYEALDRVPDREPVPGDELPGHSRVEEPAAPKPRRPGRRRC